MQTVTAAPELAASVRATIAARMASELLNRGTDLEDEAAVICALAGAGFGEPSVRALHDRTTRLARAVNAYNARIERFPV